MKLNIFNVKEKKEKKIILEEERTQNPFLLFLKRHKNFILASILMLLFCLILISTGLAFSLFRGSNDYDISYIEGDETIDSNNGPEIDDEEVKDELLGEIAREEGIVLLVKSSMSSQGDVIYYYTDGTTVLVKTNGKIYRVSPNSKGNHNVDENGEINKNAKKVLVTSTTSTLMDGTIITYYSDGSAKVEYKNQTYFVRDSNNIKLNNANNLDNLAPSGVAPAKETHKKGNNTAIVFTDGTSLVIMGDQKYIVNKHAPVEVGDTNINYDKNNAFVAISERKLKDGNIITHYTNGSATITEPNGNVTYVKRSGDILLKNKKLYEIYPNPTEISNSRATIVASDNTKITYFDNGDAVIIHTDGTRQYVEDNDEIVYDSNKNISSNPTTSKQIAERLTEDGERAYSFDNGKTQVIKEDGTSYIIATDKLEFKPLEDDDDDEDDDGSHGSQITNPGEGIYISEAENVYNDFKNVEDTKFIIKNNNTSSRTLRITIEEVKDYKKYNTSRLDPKFVKFQATVGDNYVPASRLTKNTWTNSDGVKNYIIYEGSIKAKETVQVALALYVDYAELDNSHQNKGFIGTIRIYVDDNFET